MNWKDTTSYSRDKARIPTTWSVNVAGIRITVTSSHLYYPGQWVVHCSPWFDTTPLKLKEGATAEEAQLAATRLVGAKIDDLHRHFHFHADAVLT